MVPNLMYIHKKHMSTWYLYMVYTLVFYIAMTNTSAIGTLFELIEPFITYTEM